MEPLLPDVAGSEDFSDAAQRVLNYLREALPMTFWSVTRVENGRQTYLYLDESNGYGLHQGGSHPWQDGFCVNMVSGAGPAVALDVQAVPVYAEAPVNHVSPFGAYLGAPVREADGTAFGAICGLDRHARTGDPVLGAAGPVLSLLGQLLTLALAMDRSRETSRRMVEGVREEAETDALTSLLNRRGWDRRIRETAPLLRRLGDPTVVAVVDLDRLKRVNDTEGHAAGDDCIRRAARALVMAVREGDLVARLGGDEFAVLLRNCDEQVGVDVVDRVTDCLREAGVEASVGWAPVFITSGLDAAIRAADRAMYANKQARTHGA